MEHTSKGKALVIVESPAKIKTLKQFLGPQFVFESSFGHVRDLPESKFGIDIENDFEPTYTPLSDKKEVVSRLKKAAKECDIVYLAPDPDREGEAIAWHISQLLGPKVEIRRVSFNSITKAAVKEALAHPKGLDMPLVHAQQARRLLDRLVGYTISPLLSRKLGRQGKNSISAGRVQSVALKLVVDRERAIEAFIPREYWNITATVRPLPDGPKFSAFLHSIDGKRIDKDQPNKEDTTVISNELQSQKITKDLEESSPYTVLRLEKKERRRQPEAPFITSTLQQEASRHFRISPMRTMSIAQELYEGIDLGASGTEGLITYMRTDSVRTAQEAIDEVRGYIVQQFGEANLPEEARRFQVKKSAQDAHEAIRPTIVSRTPDSIRDFLTKDQYLLYSLIWKRFVASQMAAAVYDTVSCDLQAGEHYLLRATGSQIKHPGFLTLYEEKQDEDDVSDENRLLPDLEVGQKVSVDAINAAQAFTRPPPRFTEASLIKELEKSGIGRPSTYATIMKKISAREYTVKEQGRLKPTELGRIVTEMLETNFQEVLNVGFTALMEDSLEEVASDKKDWRDLLREFWKPFSKTVEEAKQHAAPPKVMTDIPCPNCKAPLQKVWFKSSYFLGCSRYPDCNYSASLQEMEFDKSIYRDDFDWEQPCPKCQTPMKLRFGRFGPFLGCTKYPECRGIVKIPRKDEPEPVPCPAAGCDGMLVQRRSRFKKPFWSCSRFPDCDVVGSTVEAVREQFEGRPQTAYVKKIKEKKTKEPKVQAKEAKAKGPKKKAKAPAKRKKKEESEE
jgi:DNA topoisomerase-1